MYHSYKMKNGIAYPLSPEVINIIEKKRKEFIKNVGVKVSQAKFTGIIAPGLRTAVQNIKLSLKPTIKYRKIKKRKWR